jgi:CheY-like chemotaxis protein
LSGSVSDARTVLLLVEDEPLVRMFNADVLDDAGFRVVEAANADEAIALFEARPDIRAVVTDIEMPGPRNGLDLAEHIKTRRPLVGVIIVSGREHPKLSAFTSGGGRFLAKPYSAADLLHEVQVVLGTSEQTGGTVEGKDAP